MPGYQIFVVRKIREKTKKWKNVAFLDLMERENTFNRVNREVMWQVLEIFGAVVRVLARIKD